MKPVEFKEQNIVFAKDQPQYLPLPAFRNNSEQGEVVSCWNLSFKERLKILFTGKVWLKLLTFNNSLQPQYLTVNKYDIFNK